MPPFNKDKYSLLVLLATASSWVEIRHVITDMVFQYMTHLQLDKLTYNIPLIIEEQG
jgi:hypothetical protein